jgi:hypothetical protein
MLSFNAATDIIMLPMVLFLPQPRPQLFEALPNEATSRLH